MKENVFQGIAETPYHKTRGIAKPVVKIKDGIIIKQYNSISEAARDNNIYFSNISDVIHGYHSQTHGYVWKYADYTMPEGVKKANKRKTRIMRPCKVVFEKTFDTKPMANEFIKQNNLNGAKVIFTRKRSSVNK